MDLRVTHTPKPRDQSQLELQLKPKEHALKRRPESDIQNCGLSTHPNRKRNTHQDAFS